MVLMVLSFLHLMAFYLPDNQHPQLQPVHRAIHLKSCLQRASSSSSLAARHSAGIIWAPSGPSPSVVVSPQWEGSRSFVSQSSCCFDWKSIHRTVCEKSAKRSSLNFAVICSFIYRSLRKVLIFVSQTNRKRTKENISKQIKGKNKIVVVFVQQQ